MYSLILTNQDLVIDRIESERNHFIVYEDLISRCDYTNSDYQNKYRKYWGMNRAISNSEFYEEYFNYLASNELIEIGGLIERLSLLFINRKATNTAQISFSTKLLHTKNPNLPIFDAHVKRFFYLTDYSSLPSTLHKIQKFENDYEFLKYEYNRIIANDILKGLPQRVRDTFRCNVSDVKIIDSIIWAFSALLTGGAIRNREIVFS